MLGWAMATASPESSVCGDSQLWQKDPCLFAEDRWESSCRGCEFLWVSPCSFLHVLSSPQFLGYRNPRVSVQVLHNSVLELKMARWFIFHS